MALSRFERAGLRRYLLDQRGGLSVLMLCLIPLVIFLAGIAIDLNHTNTQRRYVQAQADLAALSGARQFASADSVRAAARSTVDANFRYVAFPLADEQIQLGHAGSMGAFQPQSNQSVIGGANAVRVTVRSPVRMFVLGLFLNPERMMIERDAVASVQAPRVSFALSNCLLNLRLLEPILRPLIDSRTDVLCSGRGVDTTLSLFPTLNDVAVQASLLTPGGAPLTYGQILDADVPVSDLLRALTGVWVPPSHHTVRISDFVYVPLDLRDAYVGSPLPPISVQAADLIMASAEVLATRILDLQVGLQLGSFAAARAEVRISDPRKIVIGAVPGDPQAVARTSQIELDIQELNILNIFALKFRVIVANASAALSAQGRSCSRDSQTEVVVFDPIDASLLDLQIDLRVLNLPNGSEALGLRTDTIRDRQTRRVGFTHEQVVSAPVYRFGPTGQQQRDTVASSLRQGTADLLSAAQSAIRNQGNAITCSGLLGCLIGSTLQVLKSTLQAISNTLLVTVVNVANALGAEGTLTNAILSDLIGLDIARADLEVLDVMCGSGQPRLVR